MCSSLLLCGWSYTLAAVLSPSLVSANTYYRHYFWILAMWPQAHRIPGTGLSKLTQLSDDQGIKHCFVPRRRGQSAFCNCVHSHWIIMSSFFLFLFCPETLFILKMFLKKLFSDKSNYITHPCCGTAYLWVYGGSTIKGILHVRATHPNEACSVLLK